MYLDEYLATSGATVDMISNIRGGHRQQERQHEVCLGTEQAINVQKGRRTLSHRLGVLAFELGLSVGVRGLPFHHARCNTGCLLRGHLRARGGGRIGKGHAIEGRTIHQRLQHSSAHQLDARRKPQRKARQCKQSGSFTWPAQSPYAAWPAPTG